MFYSILKRLMDIFLAILTGIIFAPIALITAIAIKLESPGPILADTPERVGCNGKSFKLYKFRSMITGAHDLLRSDPKFKKLYEEYKRSSYKLHEDPRVTKVGKFIRRHSIDEIPQLLNIIKGEMSLVGPRPYYPDELIEQQKRYPQTKSLVTEVLSIKPGLTGTWQVSGRSTINFDKRIAMDAEYARQKSIFYDIVILLKSPWAMISGRGAV